MRTRTWCVAAVLLSISMPATAQTVLSESAALARLSPDSPRVRAIRAATDLARADVLAAGRWPNPRASFNRESVAGVAENMLTVTQALPITGIRRFEVSAASELVDASARRADEEIRRARTELRAAYTDLVAAQVREGQLMLTRLRIRDLADLLARREAGDAAGYDRLRAEREVQDLDADLAVTRADRARAQGALAAFFADPGDVTTIVAAERPPTARQPLPTVDVLLARAEMIRGEPAALKHEIEAARFAERAAGRRLVPEPEVVVGTKSSNAAGGDVGGVIGVHATIPLFDRAKPERAMARARLAQAETRAAAFRAVLAAEVSGLRALVAERRDAADRYRTTSTTSAAQLEQIAQVSYDAGEGGILELLDAYRSGATARMRQAALDASVRQAEVELEFVSGWEMQ